MRVLLLNSVYREGSTGKIVASIADGLRAQGHEAFTCYGIGDSRIDEFSRKVCTGFEHNVNALMSRITGIPYGGVFLSNRRIKKIIKEYRPDVVHVHCVNASTMNVYALLRDLAQSGIKTVLTLHAEIFHTGGCSHAYDCNKWIAGCHHCEFYKERVHSWFFDRSRSSYKLISDAVNSFRKDDLTITAVSPWLADRARQSAIMKGFRIEYVPNGVDTSVFHYRENCGLINREHYSKVVLFVTPYFGTEESDIKGGRYLPEIASQLPDCKFLVVASRMSASLPSMPSNIQIWGKAKTQEELAQLYSEADATLLLSKRETFSMVTAESLCCGTPVVGFEAGGPESIALADYSRFVEYGDIHKIALTLAGPFPCDKRNISYEATAKYSQDYMGALFMKAYNNSSQKR